MGMTGSTPGLRLDADDLQEVVVQCDADGIIEYWSRAGVEITGLRPEDVVGYHLDAVIAPESREFLGRILGAQSGGSLLPGQMVKLQSSFGMEIPAEVTSFPRRSGDTITGWTLVFRDATLKVQLQEQVDRLDALYRGLVENSPDLVYVLDASARVLFINDTVETLLGWKKKDIIGKDLIDFVHPEDRTQAYWPLRERRRADRATRNLQLRFMTRDGNARRYDLGFVYVALDSFGLLTPRPGATTELMGTHGVARDVTETRVLQEFARQAGLILPVCAVCRKIRTGTGNAVEWVPLAEYVSRATGTLFSHTYCPDHLPSVQ